MNTFTIVYDDVMHDHRLNSDQKLVYSALIRRLQLSRKNPSRFYSAKYSDFFVLFSQTELAQLIGVSVRTISSGLSKLESLGMIIRRHRFNASDCIFLPKSEKFAGTNQQDLQTKDNYPEKPKELLVDNYVNNGDAKFKKWAGATYVKMGIAKSVLNAIGDVVKRDIPACFNMVQLLNNAKKHVLKTYALNQADYRYEVLEALDEPLAEQIALACALAPQEKIAKQKYLTTTFIRFFIDHFNLNPRNYLALKRKKKPESNLIDPSFPIPNFKIL